MFGNFDVHIYFWDRLSAVNFEIAIYKAGNKKRIPNGKCFSEHLIYIL